ncbi:MAG: alpha-ketoacid dehydrogenase subunit beta [Ardenticatenaceae bacterium]|nr:alpha-ketoacid dehydrogenase subunit beta [Ardenticatenaceae bacterium]HBY95839.1 alpha-ketoacid dehydrogenase subunit beta [Chloroflexota bacterium]
MPRMTFLEAIRSALRDEMAADESVIVLGEDVALKGGVFLATEGLLERYGEKRVIDTPIAEASIVGIAIGASLHGLRPVAEIQFADYIHPAIDQILNEAARLRYRSNGDWNCPIVVRAPFGAGIHGGFYHSQSTEALFTSTPGLKVVIPSTPYDAKGLLIAAIRDPDPVIFFEHKQLYRRALVRAEVPDGTYTVPIGKADVCRSGTDLSLFSYGLMVHYSMAAAEEVAAEGISVEVIDLRTLYPLDRFTILESVRKTGKALIVHEDNLTGGIGGEIGAIIAEHAFESLDGPVRRLASPDVPAVAFNDDLEASFMLNPAKIAAAIRELAAY